MPPFPAGGVRPATRSIFVRLKDLTPHLWSSVDEALEHPQEGGLMYFSDAPDNPTPSEAENRVDFLRIWNTNAPV